MPCNTFIQLPQFSAFCHLAFHYPLIFCWSILKQISDIISFCPNILPYVFLTNNNNTIFRPRENNSNYLILPVTQFMFNFSWLSQKWILTADCFKSGSKQGPSIAFGGDFCYIPLLLSLPTSPSSLSPIWRCKRHITKWTIWWSFTIVHTHATTTLIKIQNILSSQKFPSCPLPVSPQHPHRKQLFSWFLHVL